MLHIRIGAIMAKMNRNEQPAKCILITYSFESTLGKRNASKAYLIKL